RFVAAWDVATGNRVFAAENPGGTYRPNQRQTPLLFSGDGRRIASETFDGVNVWDLATERSLFQARTGPRFAQLDGCDPDIRRWASVEASGARATCRVVDMVDSVELFRIDVEIPVNRHQFALAWSPDGSRLATSLSQGNVYVLRVPANAS